MGFKLDAMMGKYKDFARGYLFYAQVTSPVGINSDHPYLVKSTSLPKQTIEQKEVDWQGNKYKFGGTSTFDAFTINFRCDAAQSLRNQFITWMRAVHNPISNIHGNPDSYFGGIDLTQLNGRGEPIVSYKLFKAFPTEVGEISLDYGTTDVSEFSVTFSYQYHDVANLYGTGEVINVNLPD